MKASVAHPQYTVYVISGNTKYDLTPAVNSIEFSDQEKQFSHRVYITLLNTQVNGTWLTGILSVCDRVYIYADDGTKNGEVFRGFIWSRPYKSSMETRSLTLTCYDNLIYFQESDESTFFQSGKTTKDVCTAICDSWGVKLNYTYESITHSKLALRGNLSDIFTTDILDLVKDRTGKKYVILSVEDVIQIRGVGTNSTIYSFIAGQNCIMTQSDETMDGVRTKVVILGKADDNDREPIEATVKGNTSKYGTIQKTINRDENTSLADAKQEAQSIIDKDGTPKYSYELKATDIPWIRKGDKVEVDAGDLSGYYIVTGIMRTIDPKNKDMTLTLEKP